MKLSVFTMIVFTSIWNLTRHLWIDKANMSNRLTTGVV